MGLGVEVDAQLFEVGGGGELRVGVCGGGLEEGELGYVAVGRVEEGVAPGAVEGGEEAGWEELFQAVVEVWLLWVLVF